MNFETLITGLGRTSFQAAVLVLLVLVVQWIFQKQLPARWRSALWLIVVARLLVPFAPGSTLSIFNLFPNFNRGQAQVPAARGQNSTSIEHASEAGEDGVSVGQTAPAHVHPGVVGKVEPKIAERVPGSHSEPVIASSSVIPAPAPPNRLIPWTTWVVAIWLIGAMSFGLYALMSSIRLHRRSQRLVPISDEQVLTTLNQAAFEMGVRQQLAVVENPSLTSPALFGFLHPLLMLPRDFHKKFSQQELRFVFLHEMAHLRRHDLVSNGIVTFLQVLHWFNPFVWLGFSRWRADREIACDAMALEVAGADQQQAYGQTILHLLEGFTRRPSVPGWLACWKISHNSVEE